MPESPQAFPTVAIILVGHTPHKFRRLRKLVEHATQASEFRIVTVFNGEQAEPCDLHVPNDLQLRDVGMYQSGTSLLEQEKCIICLNDDVEYIESGALEKIAEKLMAGVDMVGAQPNLSHWIVFKGLTQKQVLFHKRKGRALKFVRTSAFGCNLEYFKTLYAKINSAQEFEKGTIEKMSNYEVKFLDTYDLIYDGNIAEFIPNFVALRNS